MAIKNTQIEDKGIRLNKSDALNEYHYPEHKITIKASSKKEADNKLRELSKNI